MWGFTRGGCVEAWFKKVCPRKSPKLLAANDCDVTVAEERGGFRFRTQRAGGWTRITRERKNAETRNKRVA